MVNINSIITFVF